MRMRMRMRNRLVAEQHSSSFIHHGCLHQLSAFPDISRQCTRVHSSALSIAMLRNVSECQEAEQLYKSALEGRARGMGSLCTPRDCQRVHVKQVGSQFQAPNIRDEPWGQNDLASPYVIKCQFLFCL